jgi:hypothetical protein
MNKFIVAAIAPDKKKEKLDPINPQICTWLLHLLESKVGENCPEGRSSYPKVYFDW